MSLHRSRPYTAFGHLDVPLIAARPSASVAPTWATFIDPTYRAPFEAWEFPADVDASLQLTVVSPADTVVYWDRPKLLWATNDSGNEEQITWQYDYDQAVLGEAFWDGVFEGVHYLKSVDPPVPLVLTDTNLGAYAWDTNDDAADFDSPGLDVCLIRLTRAGSYDASDVSAFGLALSFQTHAPRPL